MVIGAPLVIDSARFSTASDDPMGVLRKIGQDAHGIWDVPVLRALIESIGMISPHVCLIRRTNFVC